MFFDLSILCSIILQKSFRINALRIYLYNSSKKIDIFARIFFLSLVRDSQLTNHSSPSKIHFRTGYLKNYSLSEYIVTRVSRDDQEAFEGTKGYSVTGITYSPVATRACRNARTSRCKLGGNISAVKYLSHLIRCRSGSYRGIGDSAWHEVYYAGYVAISSTFRDREHHASRDDAADRLMSLTRSFPSSI